MIRNVVGDSIERSFHRDSWAPGHARGAGRPAVTPSRRHCPGPPGGWGHAGQESEGTGSVPGGTAAGGPAAAPETPHEAASGERGTRSRQTRRQSVGVSLLEVRKTGTQSPTQISREKQNCPISTQTTQRCYWSGSQGAGPSEGRRRRTWEHMPYSQPSESAATATVAPRQ